MTTTDTPKMSPQKRRALECLLGGDIDDAARTLRGIRSHTLSALVALGFATQYDSASASHGRRWKITDAGRARLAAELRRR
jgi:hypothetical protein